MERDSITQEVLLTRQELRDCLYIVNDALFPDDTVDEREAAHQESFQMFLDDVLDNQPLNMRGELIVLTGRHAGRLACGILADIHMLEENEILSPRERRALQRLRPLQRELDRLSSHEED